MTYGTVRTSGPSFSRRKLHVTCREWGGGLVGGGMGGGGGLDGGGGKLGRGRPGLLPKQVSFYETLGCKDLTSRELRN